MDYERECAAIRKKNWRSLFFGLLIGFLFGAFCGFRLIMEIEQEMLAFPHPKLTREQELMQEIIKIETANLPLGLRVNWDGYKATLDDGTQVYVSKPYHIFSH